MIVEILLTIFLTGLLIFTIYLLFHYKSEFYREKKLRNILYKKLLQKSTEIHKILSDKEKQFQDIYDTANSIIIRWNPNFKIHSINPYAEEFFGVKKDSLIGKDLVTDLFRISGEKVNEKKSLLWYVFHKPEQFIIQEYEVYLQNGDKRTISWSNRVLRDEFGYPVEVLSIGNDITNRKIAEENLLKSYEKILDLYNNAPCGYHSLDNEGLIVSINDTELEWLGYSRDEVVGKKYLTDILSEKSKTSFRTSWKILRKEGALSGLELEYIRKDGSNFFTRQNSTVTEDADGNYSVSKFTVFDVTDKKVAEDILNEYSQKIEIQNKQLQAAVEEAELANKSKTIFFSKITHELRTPLHAVIGFSQILSKDQSLPIHLRDYVDSLYQNGIHLLNIINDILDLSKIEAGKMNEIKENFSLLQLWETIYSMFAHRFKEKKIRLELLHADRILNRYYSADIQKIRQILINLIGNSLKFTKEGNVKLEISIENSESTKDWVSFKIEDTGIGIPEDQLDLIFEAFQQTEQGQSYQEGTGLGLSISHQFVELLGGKIHVATKLGMGSIFQFAIPMEKISNPSNGSEMLGPISSDEIQSQKQKNSEEETIQEFLHSLPEKEYFEILNSIRVQNFSKLEDATRSISSKHPGKNLFLEKVKNKRFKFLLSILQETNLRQ
ncbi:MAG: PAS domain-containing sensor histidine kinase [Leptospira sp.]|nr:PAS domain-containing sensor histidine kinase [Leptospira sp.]